MVASLSDGPDSPREIAGEARGRPAPTAAARRALREAEERRRVATEPSRPVETGGRSGPEPVRYGDWEVKGIATDF